MKTFDETELQAHFNKKLVALFQSMYESQLVEMDTHGGYLYVPSNHDSLNTERDIHRLEVRCSSSSIPDKDKAVHVKWAAPENIEFDEAEDCYFARHPSIILADALARVPALAGDLTVAFTRFQDQQETQS